MIGERDTGQATNLLNKSFGGFIKNGDENHNLKRININKNKS